MNINERNKCNFFVLFAYLLLLLLHKFCRDGIADYFGNVIYDGDLMVLETIELNLTKLS